MDVVSVSSEPQGSGTDVQPAHQASTATLAKKELADLDDLVQAMRGSLPRVKPWQRKLHEHLSDIDGRIQILRLVSALGRDQAEIRPAISDIQGALRAANAYVAGGRADLGTRMAIRLAVELMKKISLESFPGPLAVAHAVTIQSCEERAG